MRRSTRRFVRPAVGAHVPADNVALGVTHMIEETARHAGHMDITRELIDGRTGR